MINLWPGFYDLSLIIRDPEIERERERETEAHQHHLARK
jgi:hypothetical protein